jgi:hypothetical protein
MGMMDGLAVWDSPGVECSASVAKAPTVALVGYDVQGRRRGNFRAASCALLQHGVKLDYGDS